MTNFANLKKSCGDGQRREQQRILKRRAGCPNVASTRPATSLACCSTRNEWPELTDTPIPNVMRSPSSALLRHMLGQALRGPAPGAREWGWGKPWRARERKLSPTGWQRVSALAEHARFQVPRIGGENIVASLHAGALAAARGPRAARKGESCSCANQRRRPHLWQPTFMVHELSRS